MAFGGLVLVSCEDKAMAEKSRLQKAQIAELQAQVEVLQASLERETVRDDQGPTLEEAEAALAETRKSVEGLQAELERLRAERGQLEKKFEDYKRKYTISN